MPTLDEYLSGALGIGERQQAAVAALGQRALGAPPLPVLLDEAVALVADILDADCVDVLELLPGAEAVLLRAGVGWRPGAVGHVTFSARGDSPAGFTLQAREPVVARDFAAEPQIRIPALWREHGVTSTISATIAGRAAPWGVLGAHTRRHREFRRDDVYLMAAVANILASSIAAAATARRLAFLAEATTVLSASLDAEATLRSLARLVVPELADWCLVELGHAPAGLRRVAVAHREPSREALGWGIGTSPPGISRVLETGRAELHAELTEQAPGPQPALLHVLGIRSAMLVPLMARDRAQGLMVLGAAESGRRYTDHDLALARDLAQRAALAADNARLYQQTESASRAKDDFLAVLSHELRTPLTSILGWARLLASGGLDAGTVSRAIETIERNARAQAALIDDLLDISQIATGTLALERGRVDLADVTEAAVAAIRPVADAAGLHLQATIAGRPLRVAGDQGRLRQVVDHLLDNAVKFTPRGGRVRVDLGVAPGSPARAVLQVSDTGQGVSPEFLPHLFEPFRQADSSLTRRHGGLGLGLAIVRHLVEMHGGRVAAHSRGEGQGATFSVELPLAPAAG